MNKIKIIDTLLQGYDHVTPELFLSGVTWYDDANNIINNMAYQYGINSTIISKVVSCLSPSCSWLQNIKDTHSMLYAFVHGKDIDSFKVTTYGNNKIKAWDVLHGKADLLPISPKTFAFHRNLLLCDKHVTIDVWILRLLQFSKDYITPHQYKIVSRCFDIASYEVGLLPYQLQSVLWCHIRGKSN